MIADEIDQLIDSVKSAANAQYAGRYVFAGTSTLTPPYSLGATTPTTATPGSISARSGRASRSP